MHYLYLGLAITAEVIGTATLKATDEFSRFWPSLVVVFSYGAAFYLLSLTLRVVPVGVAYAIWSGLGIVLIAIAGVVFYSQELDLAAVLGMGLIIAGVLVIQLFSRTVGN